MCANFPSLVTGTSIHGTVVTDTLGEEFELLAALLRQLIGLLEECDDRFWLAFMKRGLVQVEARRLAGATFVLGCYGGVDTFSDVVLARHWEHSEPLKFRNANARLSALRDGIFTSASAIASRRLW